MQLAYTRSWSVGSKDLAIRRILGAPGYSSESAEVNAHFYLRGSSQLSRDFCASISYSESCEMQATQRSIALVTLPLLGRSFSGTQGTAGSFVLGRAAKHWDTVDNVRPPPPCRYSRQLIRLFSVIERSQKVLLNLEEHQRRSGCDLTPGLRVHAEPAESLTYIVL